MESIAVKKKKKKTKDNGKITEKRQEKKHTLVIEDWSMGVNSGPDQLLCERSSTKFSRACKCTVMISTI